MFIKKLYKRLTSLLGFIPQELLVFVVAFLYRLPNLGYDFINNDAYHWKERGYAFGSALTSFDFAATAVTYHPGVPLLWCQFVSIKIYSLLLKTAMIGSPNSHDEFLINNQIQATVVVFLTSVLLAIAYRQLKRIFGAKIALITIILISIEPFYLALARALHTDAMISLFMFISVLYFYSYLSAESKKLITFDCIFVGIFAGLAFLTKSSALFLIPFFLLITGIYYFKFRNSLVIRKVLIALAFSIASFFIFWPAMWVQPIESINLYLFKGVQGIAIEEGHEHMWFGELTADPGPLFYPIVLVGRYSLVLIIPLLASIFLVFKNRKKVFESKSLTLVLTLQLFFIFYLVMITLVSKKLDRYSLPIIFPLGVLAAWVISELFNKKYLLTFIIGLIIFRIVLFIGIHPNYLAYYSPVIGGIEGGRYVIEPKWLIGYDKVAAYFNDKQTRSDKDLKVAIADFDYLRPLAEFEVLNIKHEVERNEADYFVLPVFRPENNLRYIRTYGLKTPETIIKIAGVEYYYVYKVEKPDLIK